MRDDSAIKAACIQAAATMAAANKIIAMDKAGNDAARAKVIAEFAKELQSVLSKPGAGK